MCALQSGRVGVGSVSGEFFCKYSITSDHLFALSCAIALLVYLRSVCSCAFIFGVVSFITLLFFFVCESELSLCVGVSCCFPLFTKW